MGAASRAKLRAAVGPAASQLLTDRSALHHDIEERGPHHIVATPAPIRDHPMLRAHRDTVPPSSSFPVWALVGVLAAFLLGRGSKRRRANGKRGSRVV